MDLGIKDQLALVTGSTGGIGLEIARTLAREGARVIVNGRTASTVDTAVARIQTDLPQARVAGCVADAGTAEGCAAILAAYPEVGILVNNLGIYGCTPFLEEPDEVWQRLFEVNVLSGVRLSRHHLRKMLDRGRGRIVFIASEAGIAPPKNMASYAATKSMQLSLSRSLAELTAGTEVTVNTVMPGPTKTERTVKMLAENYPGMPEAQADRESMKGIPTSIIQRLIRPEEIAATVAFLCGPGAGAINGTAIRSEGGMVRHIL